MLHIRIDKRVEGDQVLAIIKNGIESLRGKKIKYLLVHNLVAQWLYECGYTPRTEEGYFFEGVKVIHSSDIDFYDYYLLTYNHKC